MQDTFASGHDVAVYHHALSINSDCCFAHLFVLTFLSCTVPSDAWREEYKRDMAQLDTNLRALINRPSVISTTTLQELGALANKKPKVEALLPQAHALAWESPIWALVTRSSIQLLEADKGQQKGEQSLLADGGCEQQFSKKGYSLFLLISCSQLPSARHLDFMVCTRCPLFAGMI